MSPDAMQDDARLHELLGFAADRGLTDPEADELRPMLERDAEARELYALHLLVHADLAWERRNAPVIESPTADPQRPLSIETVLPARTTKRAAWAIAAAVAMMAAAGVIYWLSMTSQQTASPGPVVATLMDAADARWASEPITVGDPVRTGVIELDAGRIELQMNSGVTVSISGPAHVRLDGANVMAVGAGTVDARVPHRAIGFTVATPGVGVVDLGTEFRVAVDGSGATRVYVFDGAVRLDFSDADSRIVRAGDGWSITRDGIASRVDADAPRPPLFVLDREFAAERWRRYADELAEDESLIAHYRFDSDLVGDTLSSSAHPKRGFDGVITGATVTDGRLPGKKALRFTGEQRREFAQLGSAESWGDLFDGSFTVAVWFKVDRFAYPFHTLVMQESRQWRLVRNADLDGITLNMGWGDKTPRGQAIGETSINDGRWHLATITVQRGDKRQATTRLYIDDKLDAEHVGPTFASSRGSLWLGLNPDQPKLPNTFDGWIDELVVLDRALEADGVRELYDMGKPLE